jgi:hypothetical protein
VEFGLGCAMGKALSRWPLAEGGLSSYPRPVHVGYMVEIVARGRGFLPVLSISPCQHSTNASCPHFIHPLSSLNKTVLSFSLGLGFLRQTGSQYLFAHDSLRIRIDAPRRLNIFTALIASFVPHH